MRLARIPQIRMAVVNAAINHSHANAGSGVAGVPGCVYPGRYVRHVIQSVHGMIYAHRLNLTVCFESRQSAYWNGKSDALDQAEPLVQASAETLHSAFLLRLWNLLVLHDDPGGLVGRHPLMGSCNRRCEICSELANRPAITFPNLGESSLRNQEQQQHAQAFSPSCAVALASTRVLRFQRLRHRTHPFLK